MDELALGRWSQGSRDSMRVRFVGEPRADPGEEREVGDEQEGMDGESEQAVAAAGE